MDLNIYHHFVNDRQIEAQLAKIITKLSLIQIGVEKLMATLAELTTQVAANTTVIAGAVTLIEGIAARIEAAGTDPVKLSALVTELKTSDDTLAAAVAANTQEEQLPEDPPAA